MNQPTLRDIREAHGRIKPYIHRTPVLTNASLNELTHSQLYFKCENFQKVGAFKFRGASNTIFSLSDEEAKNGVVTHSSGNHAAALALAASQRGITAYIVMPSNAPGVKIAAVKHYGGVITFCEPTLQSREDTAQRIIVETGALMIHPFNDYRIIAGQGTAALELLEDAPDLDMILAPVGGGGLISGTAIAAKSLNPKIRVIAGEPSNADDAFHSRLEGRIFPPTNAKTIADGLRTSLGDRTFPIIREFVDDIALATEEEIIAAMRLIFERMKIIIEPSSAVPAAVVFSKKVDVEHKKVGIIFSGGNVDFSSYFEALKNY